MCSLKGGLGNPELRELVAEASSALARLDAERLEELALSCEALNRSLETMGPEDKARLEQQAHEAQSGMAVFERVLEATRSNLRVMNRLRELRMGSFEYNECQARGGKNAEGEHGID